MHRRNGASNILPPLVTTLAFVLIVLSFASGPIYRSSASEEDYRAASTIPSEPAAMAPIGQEDLALVPRSENVDPRPEAVSSRGGSRQEEAVESAQQMIESESDVFVSRPLPVVEPVPTPEASPEPTAAPPVTAATEPSPAPAQEPAPAEEPAPEPTDAPVPAPAAEPAAVALATETAPLSIAARVGIQSGHWESAKLPAELASLRTSTGAEGKDWTERGINLQVSEKVVALLRERGVEVDLIPATVPPDYQADAFVSLHGDANSNKELSGFKAARASWSQIPEKEDALVNALTAEYGPGTGLTEHRGTITQNMLRYYAFNFRQLDHAVAPSTPSAILEMGFLTNKNDLALLTEEQDRVAKAIVNGIVRFLEGR